MPGVRSLGGAVPTPTPTPTPPHPWFMLMQLDLFINNLEIYARAYCKNSLSPLVPDAFSVPPGFSSPLPEPVKGSGRHHHGYDVTMPIADVSRKRRG